MVPSPPRTHRAPSPLWVVTRAWRLSKAFASTRLAKAFLPVPCGPVRTNEDSAWRPGFWNSAAKKEIHRELASLRPVPRLPVEVRDNRLAEWRQNLRGSTTQARTVLERILRGRITFTPREDGSGYDFSAPTRFDRLFAGIVVPVSEWPSWIPEGDTTGADHFTPEDTGDAEYGRLLEQAILRERGVRARRESNPRPTGSKPVALSN
jgi:hypothetical protein